MPVSALRGRLWRTRSGLDMKHRDAAPTNGTYDEVLTTGEIFATIPSGFQVRAKNGPFQSRESADYALDVAWEAPDSDD